MVHYAIICSCKDDSEEVIQALHHYTQAEVDGGIVYVVGDDAHVKVS
jgi:DNA-binding LacI/PurR family transcriptional regulator